MQIYWANGLTVIVSKIIGMNCPAMFFWHKLVFQEEIVGSNFAG